MRVSCFECALRACGAFKPVNDVELAFINEMKRDHLVCPAGAEIVPAGEEQFELYTLYAGWAFRCKTLPDGRRQILNFLLPGDLIGLQMGLSFASFVDPQNNTQSPILGSLLNIMASLLFLSMNGHLMILEAITNSFHALPIGQAGFGINALPVNAMQLLSWGGEIFQTGLHLALPLLATMLVLNLAVGVLARAAPQLSLFELRDLAAGAHHSVFPAAGRRSSARRPTRAAARHR